FVGEFWISKELRLPKGSEFAKFYAPLSTKMGPQPLGTRDSGKTTWEPTSSSTSTTAPSFCAEILGFELPGTPQIRQVYGAMDPLLAYALAPMHLSAFAIPRGSGKTTWEPTSSSTSTTAPSFCAEILGFELPGTPQIRQVYGAMDPLLAYALAPMHLSVFAIPRGSGKTTWEPTSSSTSTRAPSFCAGYVVTPAHARLAGPRPRPQIVMELYDGENGTLSGSVGSAGTTTIGRGYSDGSTAAVIYQTSRCNGKFVHHRTSLAYRGPGAVDNGWSAYHAATDQYPLTKALPGLAGIGLDNLGVECTAHTGIPSCHGRSVTARSMKDAPGFGQSLGTVETLASSIMGACLPGGLAADVIGEPGKVSPPQPVWISSAHGTPRLALESCEDHPTTYKASWNKPVMPL
ncbi:hypothetical protein THAOC_10073, partial [Thalassiosira oceanica]